MTDLNRRSFLRTGTAVAAGATLGGGAFQGFFASAARAAQGHPPHGGDLDYGPLHPTSDLRDGQERLLLPAGFRYRSFTPTGYEMSDGHVTPGRHDGMAAFRGPRGTSVLVRNHEVNGAPGAFGDVSRAYDPMTGGGTTTVVVGPRGQVYWSGVSLNGTQMNCSGGPMPWGTWVTCEETVNGGDVGPDFTGQPNDGLQKHGYIFEVPARGRSSAEPVTSAGRFAHEAAAWDHRSQALYLTEDNFAFPSGFYRYLPPVHPARGRRLRDGGRLQMLKVAGWPQADLAGVDGPAPAVGSWFHVEWVDIEDPDPTFAPGTTNDEAIQAVSQQGLAQGAARFARLEGAVAHRSTIYFASTQGGSEPADAPDPSGYGRGRGQIWAYHTPSETLHLLYESPSKEVLDLPDNVTTSKRGTLVLCEDGSEGNYLRGLTRDGRIFDFAKNNILDRTDDEFAGSTFSHDYETLFVNIQASDGLTFAIWGPWHRGGF